MTEHSISLLAFAKINLHLQVTGRRADGYHNISSLMQSVSLADRLSVRITDAPEIRVETEGAEIAGDNLVRKAAEAFLRVTGRTEGVAIRLLKQIPLSAGLGGGSADAAAVLLALNRLFGNPLERQTLLRLGLSLGADVPFCMTGGTQLCEGLGEVLTPVPAVRPMPVLLIKQFQKASTGAMYQRIDQAGCDTGEILTGRIAQAIGAGRFSDAAGLCRNSFLQVSPNRAEQERLCRELIGAGAVLAGLSGSGPTVFGLFEALSDQTVEAFKVDGREVYRCETVDKGVSYLNN